MCKKTPIKLLVLFFSFSVMLSSCSLSNESESTKLRKELEELKKDKDGQKNSETEKTEKTEESNNQARKKTKTRVKMDCGYLTLRNAPDAKTGKPIAKIPNGAVVMVGGCQKNRIKIAGRDGRWCQATYKDQGGWAFDAFLVEEGKQNHLITEKSAGNIRLGMSVAEARKAMSNAKFSRTENGEMSTLIAVKQGDKEIITLYAGEKDSDEKRINENAKIEHIQVWSDKFKTAEGVHPKMKISDVEKIYGKVTADTISEIESRRYMDFANQPKYFSYRVEDEDFEAMLKDDASNVDNSNKSYKVSPYIHSIEISK